MVIVDGMTFTAKARELGPAVLEWWDQVWRDEDHPLNVRLRASELIVERGFGKAFSTLDININERQLTSLTFEELEALALGEQPRFPIALEQGDVVDASFPTVTTTEAEP